MTQRELLATQAATEPAPRAGQSSVRVPPSPPPASPAPRTSAWEEIYRRASPAQQAELLALAERQGILYGHQIPAPANGSEPQRHSLPTILAGATDLPAFSAAAGIWIDTALDEQQREAVARALHTPDVCLIEGMPGTGKSRVIAELVTQAALAGQRVLLLAATPAGLDRVLEDVGARDAVLAIRCLARHEHADDVPPAVRALTVAERLRRLTSESLPAARRAAETAGHRCQRLQDDTAVLAELGTLAEQLRDLQLRHDQLAREREQVPAVVEREADSLDGAPAPEGNGFLGAVSQCHGERAQLRQSTEAELSRVRQQIAEQQKQKQELEPDRARLAPLAEAKKSGRWWTAGWWQATLNGDDIAARLADVETRCRACDTALEQCESERSRLSAELTRAEEALTTQRRQLCAAEAQRRQDDLAQRIAALAAEMQTAETKQQSLRQRLVTDLPALDGLPTAVQNCQVQLVHANKEAAFARDWRDTLEASLAGWPARLPSQANLVAATVGGLASDDYFGDAAVAGRGFDLLVIDETHLVAEADLLHVATRARRSVLVGEPDWLSVAELPPRPVAPATRRPVPGPPPFHRLWKALNREPRCLPYAWVQENGHWCCRLRSLTAEQRQMLECERVADCPDIELRILALARTPPALAEVVFPPSMSLVEAKQYIFRELQELPVQATGDSFRWCEEPERLMLRLSENPLPATIPVVLEKGVRELVSADGVAPGRTCCLEFERSAGWDRVRAGDWVRRHMGVADLGRTVRLAVPHRMQHELAAFVAELFPPQAYRVPTRDSPPGKGHGGVEFVAVPPTAGATRDGKPENGRRTSAAPVRPPRGGAGLEVDLGEPRQRERLPAPVRSVLPPQGLVNWPEAQAVVAYLENLFRHPANGNGNGAAPPAVGVMSLYAGQVELIRWLIAQSPALTSSHVDIDVGLPARFGQREFPVVLLSLTRSHNHRAVTYGDGAHVLGLALTRARSRLVVFGDVGTLERRSQWQGTVDHLDEAASARERDLLRPLLRHATAAGTAGRTMQPREGTCT